jgi:hypothetical protein
LVFSLLPAWAVKSASQQSRMTWVGAILFLAFIGLMGSLAANASPASVKWEPGPYARRYRPYLGTFMGLIFFLTSLCAIAITYAEPGVGLTGGLGVSLAKIGALLFPLVAKYATSIEPPLSPDTLFRAQAIVSIFLLASILGLAACAAYLLAMPVSERRNIHASTRGVWPDRLVPLTTAVLLLISASTFFGWSEFDQPLTNQKCVLHSACYTRGDDLGIIAAAVLRVVVIIAMPVGAFLLFDANRLLPKT